jgi:SAM-dependent methyltransferase
VARTAARVLGGTGQVIGLDISAPMLAAARSAAEQENVAVGWREGTAIALPWAEPVFDVVFCQQDLQFFPDRLSALHEMHRVLKPGGRLVLGVWRGIGLSPGFAILAEALARHISAEAGMLMTSGPFGLSDAEQLRELLAVASFDRVTITPAVKVLRFPTPEEFVRRYVSGSALSAAVAAAGDENRSALDAEVETRLRGYVDDHGLGFPIESDLVVGRK